MSSAINYIQNNVTIPSYNRQQQINNAERQIAQIDRTIERNNRTIALNEEQNTIRRELNVTRRELIANNDALIANNNEQNVIRREQSDIIRELIANNNEIMNTLKESRQIGQNIVDKTEQLIDCYEKLLEIRRAKNDRIDTPETAQVTTGQVSKLSNDISKEDIHAIKEDTTSRLANIVYDRYINLDHTTASNFRDRFLQDCRFDSNSRSSNHDLVNILDNFSYYMKQVGYTYSDKQVNYNFNLHNYFTRFDRLF